jgi:hypothetical protein
MAAQVLAALTGLLFVAISLDLPAITSARVSRNVTRGIGSSRTIGWRHLNVHYDPSFVPRYRPRSLHLPWPQVLAVTAALALGLLILSTALTLEWLERLGRVAVVEAFAVAGAWIADYYRGYVGWVRANRVELDRAGYWVGFLLVVGAVRSVLMTIWAGIFFLAAPVWLVI